MKALTLWQPWATLIVGGVTDAGRVIVGPKDIENRSWPPPDRLIGQRIAIHAGKTVQREVTQEPTVVNPFLRMVLGMGEISTGCIVGTATLAGFVTQSENCWFQGPFGWLLEQRRPLKVPIACRGAQGLWDVPLEILQQIVGV